MLGELSNPWWAFILLGIFAGTASGLLGIGGGVILVPGLVLLFTAIDQKTAQGTALAAMIPMAIVGALRYMQNPDISIHWTVVILLVAGAIAGTLIGTAIVARLDVYLLRKIFAVLLLIIAAKMFVSKPAPSKIETEKNQTPPVEIKNANDEKS